MESVTKRSHVPLLPPSRQLPGSFEGFLEARHLFGPNVPRGGVGVPGHGELWGTREQGDFTPG
jgi:hypothetical protein